MCQPKHEHRQSQQEYPSLYHYGTHIFVTSFSITTSNQDLWTDTKTESNSEDTDIKQSTHGGSSQLDFSYPAQESSICHIDNVLRQ